MDSEVRTRLFWVVVTAALAVWSVLNNDVVLGLDLQGGVTIRYELRAPEDTPPEEVEPMVEATVDTLRRRIDTYGIRDSSITRQAGNEIVIELPGSGKEAAASIKSVISRVGRLEWRIMASDDVRLKIAVEDERQKLVELLAREENQGRPVDEIDVREIELAFEDVIYRWVPYSDLVLADRFAARGSEQLTADDYWLVKIEKTVDRAFTGGDISSAYPSQDNRQGAAVGVTIQPSRSSAFGDWTEEYKGQLLGIVLDGRLATDPATINERLEGRFVIQSGRPGGFSNSEIKDYLTIIKSGSLQMKPRLLYENTVGPSLGETAIAAGLQATLWGSIAVVAFMILYYRLHGIFSTLCLANNMLLLTGILMLLGATITLPGIAGLVLTIGMAVDANILVLERMREELDRAKSLPQAMKLGFERALSTILDANITTFLTAMILYKLGTGPVRGFAVVLMIGILTSVFSVLVFGRAFYQLSVNKGWFTSTKMGRLVRAGLHIPFMRVSRKFLMGSTLLAGAAIFGFATAGSDAYGLDFLGGYKAQVRLLEPATQGEVLAKVTPVFPGAQVISVADDSPGDASRQFIVKVKTGAVAAADEDENDLAASYARKVQEALAGRIRPPFVDALSLVEDEESLTTTVSAVLNFEGSADPAAVAGRLGFLSGVETSADPSGGVAVGGVLSRVGVDEEFLVQRMNTALADATDLPSPSKPFLESTTISGRVGVELRDSSSRAILLAFAAIVVYIRLRFQEFSYGISAVVALVHDVLLALGGVVLAHKLGIVNIEIDLSTIAAFLTIVGYSLNDTIVLFDRVRENLPRLDRPLEDVIDVSMNQVLGRSLLTSITVLVPLAIIFFLNWGRENVLEGFAFTMGVGVLVGTYSSIFIAAPVLVMMHTRAQAREGTAR